MPKAKITTKAIEVHQRDAQETGKGVYLWDAELRGFGCWITPSGQVSWVFQHWMGGHDGRPVRDTYGSLPSMKLPDARKQAETFRGAVNAGTYVRPRQARIKRERAELAAMPLSTAIDRYLKDNGYDPRSEGADDYWG